MAFVSHGACGLAHEAEKIHGKKRGMGGGVLHIKQVSQIQNAVRFTHPALWPLDKRKVGFGSSPSLVRGYLYQ